MQEHRLPLGAYIYQFKPTNLLLSLNMELLTVSKRTRRVVPAVMGARAVPLSLHWTTGAVNGSSTPTPSRRNYCTAANFPEIVFARLRSDAQHHDANSINAQARKRYESLDAKNS